MPTLHAFDAQSIFSRCAALSTPARASPRTGAARQLTRSNTQSQKSQLTGPSRIVRREIP